MCGSVATDMKAIVIDVEENVIIDEVAVGPDVEVVARCGMTCGSPTARGQ